MKSGSRDGMDRRNMGGEARLDQSLEKWSKSGYL